MQTPNSGEGGTDSVSLSKVKNAARGILPLMQSMMRKQSLLRRVVSRILHSEGVPSHQVIHLEVKSLSDIETVFNSSIR